MCESFYELFRTMLVLPVPVARRRHVSGSRPVLSTSSCMVLSSKCRDSNSTTSPIGVPRHIVQYLRPLGYNPLLSDLATNDDRATRPVSR